MKKIIFLSLILAAAFGLAACKNQAQTDSAAEISGVPETGLVLDITEKNGQTTTVTPGDVLYLKLTGEADSGKQWTVTAPTKGNSLRLKDHKIVGLDNPEILAGQFTDEWWLKIEEPGAFDLKFDYGVSGEPAEQFFSLEVVSQ